MSDCRQLIPPPPVVRDRLAIVVCEARLLRSLLRLSLQIADDLRGSNDRSIIDTADRQGGGR